MLITRLPKSFGIQQKKAGPSAWICTTSYLPNALQSAAKKEELTAASPRFAIDAIAAGKQGAISIHRFVQPNTSLTIGRNRRDFYELDKTNLALGDYDRAPRQAAGMDDAIDAHRSFRDAHLTLTEAQVKTETARCLGCGASVVDPNKCIGCGVCTTKCEFDAIHLHRDLPECSTMVRSEDKFKAILPYMAKREVKIRFGKKDK